MSDRRRAILKLILLVALIVGGAAAASLTPIGGYLSREGIGEGIAWLRGSTAAPLIYVVVYTLATAMAIPGSVLTLAGGAMFGVAWGTVYTTIGANLGANAAFGVARLLGREGVTALAGSRIEALDRATQNHGFRGLLTLRLIPLVPFNALNFGSGLTAIGWPTYATATVIGIFPGTVVYTMFADALLEGSQEASRGALVRVLISGALLVSLSFLPALAKRLGVRVPGAAILALAAAGLFGAAGRVSAQVADDVVDHAPFTEVLTEVVRVDGVDYEALKEARAGLDEYLQRLANVPPAAVDGASRDAQLAFWINAYNACMLRLVVDHYPIEKNRGLFARIANSVAGRPDNSVWQIPDVFTEPHCDVAGGTRSQDEIEHSIVRPMGEPRIHFAVNCAAKSCPVLWPEAFTAEALQRQLDRGVANLIGNAQHFRLDDEGLRLNRVMDWFRDDFGGLEGLRIFLADYLSAEDAALVLDENTPIEFFEYDWTLNDVGR